MNQQGDDDGLPDLLAALDGLRRSDTGKGAGAPPAPVRSPLGGGATALDFTSTLLATLVAEPTGSPTVRSWVDELAPAGGDGDRVTVAARSLLEAFPEPDDLLTTLVDTLLAADESETLAALLRHTSGTAGLHLPHRTTLTALLDARLLPLCELAVTAPEGSLPAALTTALVVAPSYAQAMRAMSVLDAAGEELLELTLVVNSCAVTALERLAAAIPETVEFRAGLAAERARYASNLAAAGRHSEAVSEARRALAVVEELASDAPEEYLPDLVEVLAVLVHALLLRDRSAEAREVIDRVAATAHDMLAEPAEFASIEVCNALSRLATLAHDNGCEPAACRIGLLGLDFLMRLEDPVPEQLDAFCRSAMVLADWLPAQGAVADAVSVLERAAVVAEELAGHDRAFAATESEVLRRLVAALAQAGRIAEAATVARRAQRLPGAPDADGRG
ncbi:hypothetical protein [Streptomyces sp. NPDC046727]|uniref:hypothetical protein n=1 Tax=Streptomyces sp. NPDC046727 TaxID=3155373 RepID=UPI00340D4FDB